MCSVSAVDEVLARAVQSETGAIALAALKAVCESAGTAAVVSDTRGRLMFVSAEAERMFGASPGASSQDWARQAGVFLPDMQTPVAAGEDALALAIQGIETPGQLLFVRNPQQPAGLWVNCAGSPIRDGAGAVCGGVAVYSDVTLPQALLRAEAERAGSLGGADGAAAILQRLTRLRELCTQLCNAVEQTADSVVITNTRGTIEYVNPAFEKTTGYSAAEALGQTPRILKSGKHDREFYRELWSRLTAGETFRGTIVNRKKSGELYHSEQTISPIRDGGGTVTHYVSVLKDITALRQVQRQEMQMELAREVQQRYYDAKANVPGFDVAGAAFPADQTGGDYFDFLPQPDGTLIIVIADVVGHGIGSALLMAETRAALRAYAGMLEDIPAVIRKLNSTLEDSLRECRFVTMLLGRLNPCTKTFEYTSAGHEPGYVLRSSGNADMVLTSTLPPLGLGLISDRHLSLSGTVTLEPGDILVLLTDGISDAFRDRDCLTDTQSILRLLRSHANGSARDLIQHVCEDARQASPDAPQADDMTMVVCSRLD